MQVQLNTTTNNYQNPNFNAEFSKRAQLYVDNELKNLATLGNEIVRSNGNYIGYYYMNYYDLCMEFAKDLIKEIKNIKLPNTQVLIDMNNKNEFVYKEYHDTENEADSLSFSCEIPNNYTINPFIKTLLALKKSCLDRLYGYRHPEVAKITKADEYRYDEISKKFPGRPDDDFIMKEWPHQDVRWHVEASTNYKPLENSYVSGWAKDGKYYYRTTWGRY